MQEGKKKFIKGPRRKFWCTVPRVGKYNFEEEGRGGDNVFGPTYTLQMIFFIQLLEA